ncbi:CDP-alcohol phosphatidyltransferase family protein [Patescibacteria group bacterium]|nr:MAG: CDP-alcohol phosphatidyltransferase family protein [Patescibacteria group bacterium]
MFSYAGKFVTDPRFQEEQRWVRWITSKLAVVHHDVWTAVRIPGGLVVIALDYVLHPGSWTSFMVFLLFAFTDWADGKVARFRQQKSSGFGDLFDGLADKLFILPVLFWWGRDIIPIMAWVTLIAVELGGQLLLLLYANLFVNGQRRSIYQHTIVGKIKMGLQVVMACALWIGHYLGLDGTEWEPWAEILMNIVIALALLSVLSKANRKILEFITPAA